MMNRPEWYERLVSERDDLQERCTKLETFMESESFRELDRMSQYMLHDQRTCTRALLNVLTMRILRHINAQQAYPATERGEE